jgi:hypothetical protein
MTEEVKGASPVPLSRDQKSGRIFSRHFLLAGIFFLHVFFPLSTTLTDNYQILRKAEGIWSHLEAEWKWPASQDDLVICLIHNNLEADLQGAPLAHGPVM